jgi:hypothetical protein
MAVGKKKAGSTTRRRKPGAARKPAKRKKASMRGDSETVSIGGKKFAKQSCHGTKSAAQKHAEKIREGGTLARVIKNGSKMCVYHGPKRKRA